MHLRHPRLIGGIHRASVPEKQPGQFKDPEGLELHCVLDRAALFYQPRTWLLGARQPQAVYSGLLLNPPCLVFFGYRDPKIWWGSPLPWKTR